MCRPQIKAGRLATAYLQTAAMWLRPLREVLVGELGRDANASIHRVNRSLLGAEEGFIPFVSAVTVLFFTVLTALVLNVGQVVTRKIEVQNAADAVALSAATSVARGLNSVTATNHLLGELTAICVLHEALGGSELDGVPTTYQSSRLSNAFNSALRTLQAPASLDVTYHIADPQVVNALTQDNGRRAWGTIFDARMTLKYYMCYALLGRAISGLVQEVPLVGPEISFGLDIAISAVVLLIGQECKALDLLESVAAHFAPIKLRLESSLLPFMQRFEQNCVEQIPKVATIAARQVGQRNGVETYLYPATFAMPLELGPKPGEAAAGGSSEVYAGSAESPADKILSLMDPLKYATDTIDYFNSNFEKLAKQFPGIHRLKIPTLPDGMVDPNPDGISGSPPNAQGFDNISRTKLPHLSGEQWQEIEFSQWMRATYPYVRAWRKPIREGFSGYLAVSKASTWYSRWTNRYAAAKVYQYRTGTYGGQSGREPLAMYVMQGTRTRGKGNQIWTTNSAEAERRFTLLAFAHREGAMPWGKQFFGNGPAGGVVTYAQAIVYNANLQNPAGWNSGSTFQPDIGWDTLNWSSPTSQARAFEFLQGDDAGISLEIPDFPFLTLRKPQEPPLIRLNWQAKLTPVTRLEEAWQAVPAQFRSVLSRAHQNHGVFRTH